jgi:uncharacterized protein (DUF885 family)
MTMNRTVAGLLACVLAACAGPGTVPAKPVAVEASPELTAIADAALARLREKNALVRMLSGLPVTQLDDVTFEAARQDTQFSRDLLLRLNAIDTATLPEQQWLLAEMLRDTLEQGAQATDDYWFEFAVTPYRAGLRMSPVHTVLSAQPLTTAAERENFLRLLDEYAQLLDQMATKTQSQAERGVRVPQPAVPGTRKTFEGLRASAPAAVTPAAKRLDGVAPAERDAFVAAVKRSIEGGITPAYDRVLAIFDDRYFAAAPKDVGLGQYSGGRDAYLRRVASETALTLGPQEIHDLGLKNAEALERDMRAIRDKLGFKGSREQFHHKLRTDPRFIAKTPEDVERRFLEHVAKIEPHISRYFSTLPRASYGVKRLEPSAEAGMTFGYYQRPSPAEQKGLYRYNGSDLANRSLISAQHLIYHELIPGHHFHIALQSEMRDAHPIREFLLYPGFNEGWAEYAASLADEMGILDDPYDRYGHLLMQSFLNARLVVDTGMNYFGWPLEKARAYLRDHTFESETQIATETLRYSTDLPAQALVYRLGYEKIRELRQRAERELGARFDIRAFHAAVVGGGALPLDVLERRIERFIATR